MTAISNVDDSISVVIPAFNCESYLGEAIESVLAQKPEVAEIVVVDDGSIDGTAQVVQRFGERVKCWRQENHGIGQTRNRGIELTSGGLLAFLDADDRWPLDKMEKQIKALRSDPALDMVFGQAVQLRNGPEWQRVTSGSEVPASAVMPGLVPGAMLIKRTAFDRVGKFRGDLKMGEFIDWYARAKDLNLRSLILPDIVLWRRIHETNQGIREQQSRSDYARVLKASLDRRRAGQKP